MPCYLTVTLFVKSESKGHIGLVGQGLFKCRRGVALRPSPVLEFVRMSHLEQRWRVFGRRLCVRVAWHFFAFGLVWITLILFHGTPSLQSGLSSAKLNEIFFILVADLRIGFLPGVLALLCLSLAWTCIGIAATTRISVLVATLSTAVAAAFSRFPIAEQASRWLIWAGTQTPRAMQLVFIFGLAASSAIILVRHITRQYGILASDDRLALTPEDEDFAYRDLVQSMAKFLGVLLSASMLWSIADIRPMPAVSRADARELRPSVVLLATDNPEQLENLKQVLGPAQFNSWVIFGSPLTDAKFDEILQCRYPIRLMSGAPAVARNASRDTNEYLVPSALDVAGYSVSLLHAVSPGESSESLKMLSRAYAHIRLLRRFGLLLPSRVFHTPDVQLAQMREAFSSAVSRGEPAFMSASLLSFDRLAPRSTDSAEFKTFLEVLSLQGWLSNIMFVVLELPPRKLDKAKMELSLQSTTARVTVWMPARMSDSAPTTFPVRLIRGIDLGASFAARLRLSGIVSQCDGAALFDLTERPSLFPRELVYQEYDSGNQNAVFRKRGWLSSEGYRLEIHESSEGAMFQAFKFSMQSLLNRNTWQPVQEVPLSEQSIVLELNRQLDDFLRSSGVEILNLGEGRVAYSEPFRRIRLLDK